MPAALPTCEHVDAIEYLATELRRPRRTVLRWAREGLLPPPDLVLSRQTRRWRFDTLQEWLKTRR